jgi:hypothetical protein
MSSHPTEDLLQLVRMLLVENSAVSTIVEDRVTGPFSDRTGDVTGEDLYPCVVVDIVGGGGGYGFGGLQAPTIHVYAYSRTSQGDAHRLYDAIRPVLRRARLSRDGITVKGSIQEADSPMTGYNPETKTWFTRGTYRAIATALPASA